MAQLVSILIPAYNAQRWISETIHSALRQSWPRIEVIVVDDGSRDGTLSIARQFASNGVRIVPQDNQGAAAARNKAYALSRGDYIQWLDADDLIAPDKIERQMAAHNQGCTRRTLLASAWGSFAYRTRNAVFSPTPLWCDLAPNEWLLRSMELNLYMQTTAWLVSRELSDAAGPWDTRLSLDDDGEYFFRVIMASDAVRFVPDSRAFYRRLGDSSLSNLDRSNKKWESQFLSIQLHIDYLRKLENNERGRAACLKYLQDWALFYYPDRQDLFSELEKMAAEFGGALSVPQLPWKYAWIRKLFGWHAAKSVQSSYNRMKSNTRVGLDRAMARLERRSL